MSRAPDSSDAPERDLADAPEPERVRTARKARPVKRDAAATKERQRKREYRARVRDEEQAAQPTEAKPLEPQIDGHECTPAEAGQLIAGVMAISAAAVGKPQLMLTEAERAAVGEAVAPLVNKYGANLVGRWAVELNAITTCAMVLGPKFKAAFFDSTPAASSSSSPSSERPTGILTPVRTEGGPSDAAATA
jgi:hypothetical protein